jgi:hypothetical protein
MWHLLSIQKEFGVRNSPSDRLSAVEGKQNSATQCANLPCSKELLYLREGSLRLLELESDSDDLSLQDDGAFAMKPLRGKFFWLCGECSKTHIVKQWTISGVVLVLRNQKSAGTGPNLITPAAVATTQPLPVSLTVLPIPPTGHPLPQPAWLRCEEMFLVQRQAERENRLPTSRDMPGVFPYLYQKPICGRAQSGGKRSSIGRLLGNSTTLLPHFRRKSRRT